MKQRPLTISLLLCEQVIVEERTKNITPVNCFSVREVDSFPSEPVPFIAIAFLADGQGEVPLRLEVQRLDTLEEIFKLERIVTFSNPLQTFCCTLRIRNCSFPVPGSYQAILFAGKEILAQRKITVRLKENA